MCLEECVILGLQHKVITETRGGYVLVEERQFYESQH